MANNIDAAGISQLTEGEIKATYEAGTNKNSKRSNLFANQEIKSVWAGASSASLTLTNPSEKLLLTNTTATNAVGVNFNSNAAAADGTALYIPPLSSVPVDIQDIRNINHIATSGSVHLSVLNYY